MDDLISRKEAIEWVQNILATHLYYHPCSKSRNVPIDEVIDRLERVPSIDAVPVIRCKDCKYAYITNDGECKYCDIWFPVEAKYLDGDYYCASAEREES